MLLEVRIEVVDDRSESEVVELRSEPASDGEEMLAEVRGAELETCENSDDVNVLDSSDVLDRMVVLDDVTTPVAEEVLVEKVPSDEFTLSDVAEILAEVEISTTEVELDDSTVLERKVLDPFLVSESAVLESVEPDKVELRVVKAVSKVELDVSELVKTESNKVPAL